jgi:hypothetical protein
MQIIVAKNVAQVFNRCRALVRRFVIESAKRTWV